MTEPDAPEGKIQTHKPRSLLPGLVRSYLQKRNPARRVLLASGRKSKVLVGKTEPEDRADCVLNPRLGSTTFKHDGVGINPSPATHHAAEQQQSTERWSRGWLGAG